jgi:hypothetical protein
MAIIRKSAAHSMIGSARTGHDVSTREGEGAAMWTVNDRVPFHADRA